VLRNNLRSIFCAKKKKTKNKKQIGYYSSKRLISRILNGSKKPNSQLIIRRLKRKILKSNKKQNLPQK
jgi:hypothetical protein